MMDGFGGMWFGWIFWVIIIAVIIWAIVQLINKNQQNQLSGKPEESPLDILKKRYAKGEITKEEFEQMKNDLT